VTETLKELFLKCPTFGNIVIKIRNGAYLIHRVHVGSLYYYCVLADWLSCCHWYNSVDWAM